MHREYELFQESQEGFFCWVSCSFNGLRTRERFMPYALSTARRCLLLVGPTICISGVRLHSYDEGLIGTMTHYRFYIVLHQNHWAPT